jgi:hypothetical protein
MVFRKLYASKVASWSFLTNHARVLICVARDPGVRLRDIAASLDITERSSFAGGANSPRAYWSPARTDVMRCVLKPSQCIRPR